MATEADEGERRGGEGSVVGGPFMAAQWVPPRDINQARRKRIVFAPGKDPLHEERDWLSLMTARVFLPPNTIESIHVCNIIHRLITTLGFKSGRSDETLPAFPEYAPPD